MKINKRRMGKGRHPLGMGREGIIKKIEGIIMYIDSWARIIPGRYARCKATSPVLEIIPDDQNDRILLVKVKAKRILQRIKVECSNTNHAKEIMKKINEKLINQGSNPLK